MDVKTVTINYFTPTGIARRAAQLSSTTREEVQLLVEEFERIEAVVESVYDGADCLYQSPFLLEEVEAIRSIVE